MRDLALDVVLELQFVKAKQTGMLAKDRPHLSARYDPALMCEQV